MKDLLERFAEASRAQLARVREQGLFPRGINALQAMERSSPRPDDGHRVIRVSLRAMGVRFGPVRRIAPDACGKMGEHP